MATSTENNIQSMNTFCFTKITALQLLDDYLLVGEGPFVNAYSILRKNLCLRSQVLHGFNVYGIKARPEKLHSSQLCIFGGKCFRFWNILNKDTLALESLYSQQSIDDWIHDICWLEPLDSTQKIAIVTAHNVVLIWSVNQNIPLQETRSEELCILYSAHLFQRTVKGLNVIAGTVFGDVLVWNAPLEGKTHKKIQLRHRLNCHRGAVFGVHYREENSMICSTSDDRSVKVSHIDWENETIQLVFQVYGHSSRVWKALLLDNCVLSIGEDSNICCWDYKGKLKKKVSGSRGAGIRTITTVGDLIATGGDDGSIEMWNIQEFLVESSHHSRTIVTEKLAASDKKDICRVSFVDQDRLLIATSKGEIIIYDISANNVIFYLQREYLLSYAIFSIMESCSLAAIGSMSGNLLILDLQNLSVKRELVIMDSKIFSLSWVGSENLLTCGGDGKMNLYSFGDDCSLHLKCNLELPMAKQRWFTCAVEIPTTNNIVCGDRVGSLHLYNLGEKSVSSLKHVHGFNGVADVRYVSSCIVSAGRDGTIRFFIPQDTLQEIRCIKLGSHMEWISKLIFIENDLFAVGFKSTSLVIWGVECDKLINSFQCGGGHRHWDIIYQNNSYLFAHVKDRQILLTKLDAEKNLVPLKSGFHVDKICAACVLKSSKNWIVVTASEDTTICIAKMLPEGAKIIGRLQAHISSIRALSCFQVSDDEWILVSVGGRSQMICWKLRFDLDFLHGIPLAQYFLRDPKIFAHKKPWKNWSPVHDSETRFMSVAMWQSSGYIAFAVGCSDGSIRLFKLIGDTLNPICELKHHRHCVLKVLDITIGLKTLIISADTDGQIAVWDLSELQPLKPLLVTQLNQSGINSASVKVGKDGKIVLGAGGDDGSITLVSLDPQNGKMNVLNKECRSMAHAAQVTALRFVENDYLLSVSTDQRIVLWRYSGPSLEQVRTVLSSIPDIADAALVEDEIGRKSKVLLAGEGLQLMTLNLD